MKVEIEIVENGFIIKSDDGSTGIASSIGALLTFIKKICLEKGKVKLSRQSKKITIG